MRKVVTSVLGLLAILTLASASFAKQENVQSIIQRSLEANERDWNAAPQFDHLETDKDKEGTKTYLVTMLYGSPYERLVEINGQPLSKHQQLEQEKNFHQAESDRRHESPAERSKRIAKYNADRKRNHTLMTELTKAFDFEMTGTEHLDEHNVYVLRATPRKGYRPIDRDSQALTGMEGTLWIDQDTFQWVKVEAHVTHPVSMEGFLAKVEPGTRFELEKMPVVNDIWLPKHFSMKSDAKVMFVFHRKAQQDETYFDYRHEPATGHLAENPR